MYDIAINYNGLICNLMYGLYYTKLSYDKLHAKNKPAGRSYLFPLFVYSSGVTMLVTQ